MRLPDGLSWLIGPDASWSSDHEGASGTSLRVTSGSRTYYVKHGPLAAAEHQRLRWLADRIRVPDVVAFVDPFLVLADVGAPSLDTVERDDLGLVLGQTLRTLHELPVAHCPFDGRLPAVLERARASVQAGLIDPEDFDPDHSSLTPQAIYDELLATRPHTEDLVVAHGDYTPSNVLMPDKGTPVIIDVPALGVSDRYRDLALVYRDVHMERDDTLWEQFLTAYGLIDQLDEQRLTYYRLLDELL